MAVHASEMKTCLRCGLELPLTDFPYAKGRPLARCRPCHQIHKYRSELEQIVDQAPDRRPAVRLRAALTERRRQQKAFDAVWAEAVELALRNLAPTTKASWASAFADTKIDWRASYIGRTDGSNALWIP
jgi:hypothetical protein